MRVRVAILCMLVVVLLTGCADTRLLKESIAKSNNSVEYALMNYEKNKASAFSVEGQLLTLLEYPDRQVVNSLSNVSAKKELLQSLNKSSADIVDCVEKLYLRKQAQNDAADITTPIDKLALKEENILSGIEVHYFLESDTGVVVQTILIPLEHGKTGLLENKWVNGKCFNSSYTKL